MRALPCVGRPDQPSAYVSMPLTGPQVPDGLQNTLALAAEPAAKKKRLQRAHGGKQGDKGLRHFSMKVCEKVEQKGKTTYNEVADELVAEFGAHAPACAVPHALPSCTGDTSTPLHRAAHSRQPPPHRLHAALDANDGGGSTLDAQYDEKNIRRCARPAARDGGAPERPVLTASPPRPVSEQSRL